MIEHDSFDDSCAREDPRDVDADADADEERDMRRSSDTHTHTHAHTHAHTRTHEHALAITQRERNAFLRTKEWRKISTKQKHIFTSSLGKKKRGI